MCLAVPGKVLEIQGDDPILRTARVSFAGVIKNVSLTCAPEAKIGDYVLVHVGVAISIVDQQEAEQTYAYLRQMGELDGLELSADAPAVGNATSGTATSAGPTKQERAP
jgi:hydrogenase expression/formation protein HypC